MLDTNQQSFRLRGRATITWWHVSIQHFRFGLVLYLHNYSLYFPHLRVPLPAFLEIDANASAEQIEQPLIRYKGMIVMLSGIHTSHSLAVIPVTSLRPVITIFIALIIFVIFSFLNFEKIIFIRIVKLTRKSLDKKPRLF